MAGGTNSAVLESVARKERQRKGLPEPARNKDRGGDDATVKAAKAISEGVFGHELAEEIAMPLVGLSGPPTDTPLSGHVNALASHLVYGLVTHFKRKLVLS